MHAGQQEQTVRVPQLSSGPQSPRGVAYDVGSVIARADEAMAASNRALSLMSLLVFTEMDRLASLPNAQWFTDLRRDFGALQRRVKELADQQETLAAMAAGGGITLDVSNGDVYELGKRVGRDETLRELGKDQTP